MRVILQSLSVQWTRASRSGSGAAVRNSVPHYLPLPDEVLDSPGSWRQQVSFHEVADFVPAPQHLDMLGDDFERSVGLRVERKEDRLRCYFEWSPSLGAPTRAEWVPGRFAFALDPGQTGRLAFNGRLSFERGWQYHQVIHNIAWVEGCSVDMFREVDQEFRSIEQLR